jgi:CubicO group peptidase (beta-lactamase class C family)
MDSLASLIGQRAELAISQKVFPGCVVGVVYRNSERIIVPVGHLTYSDDSPIVRDTTIYDCASITKSIPTACLALHYIDKGELKLGDKLTKYVPEFKNPDRKAITIKHLLTYTIGGYPLSPYKDKSAKELTDIIMTHEFAQRPGEAFLYSNLPAFLLGLVCERLGKHSLEWLARDRFFLPLHMDRTAFFTQQFLSDEIAPTEVEENGREVRGIVHDESARVFAKEGRAVGHAGLFSCVPDLLNFLEMLLGYGERHGSIYFSAQTVEKMYTNQIADLNAYAGLGWQLCDANFMGRFAGLHTYGKTGFTGTSVVIEQDRGVAIAILSNRIHPSRASGTAGIRAFRNDIADMVFGAAEVA